jgi:hypothetical protein
MMINHRELYEQVLSVQEAEEEEEAVVVVVVEEDE